MSKIQKLIEKNEKFIADYKKKQERYRPGTPQYEECQRRIDLVYKDLQELKQMLN